MTRIENFEGATGLFAGNCQQSLVYAVRSVGVTMQISCSFVTMQISCSFLADRLVLCEWSRNLQTAAGR